MGKKGTDAKRKSWRLPLIVIGVLGLIVAWLGFGKRGIVHLYQTEMERQAYIERIQELTEENRALIQEIEKLRTDMEYVESVARRDFNMIKSNEVIFRFADKDKKDATTDSRHSQNTAAKQGD